MEKLKFTYKVPNFTSSVLAEGLVLDETKNYIGEEEVNVKIVYYKGFIHHVYGTESIRKIDVKLPIS